MKTSGAARSTFRARRPCAGNRGSAPRWSSRGDERGWRAIVGGEMMRAAIGKIVAIDGGDDHMSRPSLATASATRRGSSVSSGERQAGRDIAKGAGARADAAHDHHRRVPLLPAFADIGAAGFLADRVETVLADDGQGLVVTRRAGARTRSQPGFGIGASRAAPLYPDAGGALAGRLCPVRSPRWSTHEWLGWMLALIGRSVAPLTWRAGRFCAS